MIQGDLGNRFGTGSAMLQRRSLRRDLWMQPREEAAVLAELGGQLKLLGPWVCQSEEIVSLPADHRSQLY